MKHILCIIESLGPGGAERQLTGLAVMLKQQGYEVEVCYYAQNDFYRCFLQQNGVNEAFLPRALNQWRRFFVLKRYIKNYKADVVISYSSSPSILLCLLKLLGATFNLIVSERNTSQQIGLREKIRFGLYKWADHIVPNSYSQGLFISRHFPRLIGKLKVITNYTDTEMFCPSSDQRHFCGTERILCVGRLMPQKNIVRFIDAVARLVNDGYKLRVDWFGQDLNDAYSEDCHKAVYDHHLEHQFIFHAPSSDIQDEYRKADIFCLPSLYEGFPNVLCEAMSCGKPVLCSKVCDNPHIVREGDNGFLFDPLDSDQIYETFRHLLDLPYEKKVKMGITSREIAVRMFSKDKFISSYSELIQ